MADEALAAYYMVIILAPNEQKYKIDRDALITVLDKIS
jgi:hypothetical protein